MFAAVCKFVTTEKCTIIQTAGVVSYLHPVSWHIFVISFIINKYHTIGILSKNILLNKLFTDVAPYVSICVLCLVEELVTTEAFCNLYYIHFFYNLQQKMGKKWINYVFMIHKTINLYDKYKIQAHLTF